MIRPVGKMAFSFFDRRSGKSVRLVVKPFDRSVLSKEESIDRFLNGDAEDLFGIGKPNFELPEKARLFNGVRCECCGESAREDGIRMQDGKMVCLDCFKGCGRGWI